jgi:hypothetical protein
MRDKLHARNQTITNASGSPRPNLDKKNESMHFSAECLQLRKQ